MNNNNNTYTSPAIELALVATSDIICASAPRNEQFGNMGEYQW